MAKPVHERSHVLSVDIKPRKSISEKSNLLVSFNKLIDAILLRPRDATRIVKHLLEQGSGYNPVNTKPHPTGINKGAPGSMGSNTAVNENPQTTEAIQENLEQGQHTAVPAPTPALSKEAVNTYAPAPATQATPKLTVSKS